MSEVNYILHLNAVLRMFAKDDRITSSHRSLYLAFFELWNQKHFPQTFMVNSKQVMELAKIRSRTTYLKLLQDLKTWEYLQYHSSHNSNLGSIIEMFRFDITVVQKMNKGCSISEQVVVQKLVTINKHKNKHIINSFKQTCPKNEQVVLAYFKAEKRSSLEAKKFFNFYESIGWKLNGRNSIIDWKACARNWMLKAEEIKNNQKFSEPSHNRDNLRTNRNKNYGEPL
ncbi:hypothetical protein SAMN04487764_0617 [Gillisia sp. Hel1_33_143]|uniref:hypothetical protein n=1 Tax=Gillisia sp. Hel1_33_143 TaxID=1336796 RepID=UPI00087AD162|nr:hypothetical protein [Gillisia sp. Hel1_33_143]SDR77390.1 hypothetical protein SAMN04487764_0617 [Gillisia sp. Hel1_33_143]